MALIGVSSQAHIEGNSAKTAVYIPDLIAGSALTKMQACRIDATDGKVYAATSGCATLQFVASSSVVYAPNYAGFVAVDTAAGMGLTLWRDGTIFSAASGSTLTPGQPMFIASAGNLNSGSPVVAGDQAVAMAINTYDIIVVR